MENVQPVNDLDFTSESAFLDSLTGSSESTPQLGNESPEQPITTPPAAQAPDPSAQQPLVNAQPPAAPASDPNDPNYWRSRYEEESRTRSAAQAKMFETLNEMKQIRAQFEQRMASPEPSTPPPSPAEQARASFVQTFRSEYARLSHENPDADPEEIRAQASLNAYAIDRDRAVQEAVARTLESHPMVQKTNEWAREQRAAKMRETVQTQYPHLNDMTNPVSVKTWEKFHELLRDAGEASGVQFVTQGEDGRISLTPAYYNQIDGAQFLSEAHKLALGELREEEFKTLLTNAYQSGQRDAQANTSRTRVVATVPVGSAPMPRPAVGRPADSDFFAQIAAS